MKIYHLIKKTKLRLNTARARDHYKVRLQTLNEIKNKLKSYKEKELTVTTNTKKTLQMFIELLKKIHFNI